MMKKGKKKYKKKAAFSEATKEPNKKKGKKKGKKGSKKRSVVFDKEETFEEEKKNEPIIAPIVEKVSVPPPEIELIRKAPAKKSVARKQKYSEQKKSSAPFQSLLSAAFAPKKKMDDSDIPPSSKEAMNAQEEINFMAKELVKIEQEIVSENEEDARLEAEAVLYKHKKPIPTSLAKQQKEQKGKIIPEKVSKIEESEELLRPKSEIILNIAINFNNVLDLFTKESVFLSDDNVQFDIDIEQLSRAVLDTAKEMRLYKPIVLSKILEKADYYQAIITFISEIRRYTSIIHLFNRYFSSKEQKIMDAVQVRMDVSSQFLDFFQQLVLYLTNYDEKTVSELSDEKKISFDSMIYKINTIEHVSTSTDMFNKKEIWNNTTETSQYILQLLMDVIPIEGNEEFKDIDKVMNNIIHYYDEKEELLLEEKDDEKDENEKLDRQEIIDRRFAKLRGILMKRKISNMIKETRSVGFSNVVHDLKKKRISERIITAATARKEEEESILIKEEKITINDNNDNKEDDNNDNNNDISMLISHKTTSSRVELFRKSIIIFSGIIFCSLLLIIGLINRSLYTINHHLIIYTCTMVIFLIFSFIIVFFSSRSIKSDLSKNARISLILSVIAFPILFLIGGFISLELNAPVFVFSLFFLLSILFPVLACLWYPFIYLVRLRTHNNDGNNNINDIIVIKETGGGDVVVPGYWATACSIITCLFIAVPLGLAPLLFVLEIHKKESFLSTSFALVVLLLALIWSLGIYYKRTIIALSYSENPQFMSRLLKPINVIYYGFLIILSISIMVCIFISTSPELHHVTIPTPNLTVNRSMVARGIAILSVMLIFLLIPLGASRSQPRIKLLYGTMLTLLYVIVLTGIYRNMKDNIFAWAPHDEAPVNVVIYLVWVGAPLIMIWVCLSIVVPPLSHETVEMFELIESYKEYDDNDNNNDNVNNDNDNDNVNNDNDNNVNNDNDNNDNNVNNNNDNDNAYYDDADDDYYDNNDDDFIYQTQPVPLDSSILNIPISYSIYAPFSVIFLIIPIFAWIPLSMLLSETRQPVESYLMVCIYITLTIYYLYKRAKAWLHYIRFMNGSETTTLLHTYEFIIHKYYSATFVGSWTTSICAVICIFYILYFLGMRLLDESIVPSFICIALSIPLLVRLSSGDSFTAFTEKYHINRYIITIFLYIFIPIVAFGPVPLVAASASRKLNNFGVFSVVLAIGTPLFAIITMIIWGISDFFGGSSEVLQYMRGLCCFFIIVPFFVIVPALYYSPVNPFSNVGEILSLLCIALMIVTCIASMSLNARLQHISTEKKTKLSVLAVRKKLRKLDCMLTHDVGVDIHNIFQYIVKESKGGDGDNISGNQYDDNLDTFRDWLLSEKDISFVEKVQNITNDDNNNNLCKYEIVQTEVKEERLKLRKEQASSKRRKLLIRQEDIRRQIEEHRIQAEAADIVNREEREAFLAEYEERKLIYERERAIFDSEEEKKQNKIRKLQQMQFARMNGVARKRAQLEQILDDLMDVDKEIDEELLEKEFRRILDNKINKVDIDDDGNDNNNNNNDNNRNDDKASIMYNHSCWDYLFPTKEQQIQSQQQIQIIDNITNNNNTNNTNNSISPLPAPPRLPSIDAEELSMEGAMNAINRVSSNIMTSFENALLPNTSNVDNTSTLNSNNGLILNRQSYLRKAELASSSSSSLSINNVNNRNGNNNDNDSKDHAINIQNNWQTHVNVARAAEEREKALQELSIGHRLLKRNAERDGTVSNSKDDHIEGDKLLAYQQLLIRCNYAMDSTKNQQLDIVKEAIKRKKKLQKELLLRRSLHKVLLPLLNSWIMEIEQEEVDILYEREKTYVATQNKINNIFSCWKLEDDDVENKVDLDTLEGWLDTHEDDVNIEKECIEVKYAKNALEEAEKNIKEVGLELEKVNTSGILAHSNTTITMSKYEQWVDIITETFSKFDTRKVVMRRYEDLPIEWSLPNGLAILDIFLELYSLSAIPFDQSINWDLNDTEEAATGAPLLRFPTGWNLWNITFWCCVSIAAIYPVLAVYGAKLAKKGALGHDSSGKKIKTCSLVFFFLQILYFLGSTCYFMVIKNLIDTIICSSGDESHLISNPNIECWEDTHILFVICAFLCGTLYYPLASFMLPNMQFMDDTLDIKYSPRFMVFKTQGKLLVASVTSFLRNQPILLISVAFGVYMSFAVVNNMLKPCVIRRLNTWNSAVYIAAAWVCVAALFVELFDDGVIGLVIILIGWVVIFILAFIKYYRRWGGFSVHVYTQTNV